MRDLILFASPRPPLPLDSGGIIRIQRLAEGLSKAFDVVFVTFERGPGSGWPPVSEADIRGVLPDAEVVLVPGLGSPRVGDWPRRRTQARSLLGPSSWTWAPYRRPAFADALRALTRSRRPALVHFDDPILGFAAPIAGPVNVLATQNVEHRIIRSQSAGASVRRRAVNAVEWRKVRREERAAWRSVDLCVAVSDLDAAAMLAGGARRATVCPGGTDPVDSLPLPARDPSEPLRILFVGTGVYPPNARGVAWFVREVLPRIRERTDAVLDVVGRPPEHPVQAPGVTYAGSVPSLQPYYERCHLTVAPIFEGSGTRMKIIEAMAYGRPVVSTELGAEGLPVRPGEHYVQADEPADFARAVLEVSDAYAAPAERLTGMVDAARAAVSFAFWPNVVGGLAETYREEIERARGGVAPRSEATSLPS